MRDSVLGGYTTQQLHFLRHHVVDEEREVDGPIATSAERRDFIQIVRPPHIDPHVVTVPKTPEGIKRAAILKGI